jgi:hypothetical protein
VAPTHTLQPIGVPIAPRACSLFSQRTLQITIITGHQEHQQDHGYLSYQHHVVLGLEEVNCLVRTLPQQPSTCGLTVGKTAGDVCGKRVGWNSMGVGKRARGPESKYMYFILGECMYVQGEWKGGVSVTVRLVLTSEG